MLEHVISELNISLRYHTL